MITLGMGENWSRFSEVAQKGKTANGKIIELTPQIHNTAKYQFMANGRILTGSTRIEEDTAVGEPVTVYYFANDPDHNCVDPLSHAHEMFVSAIVMAVLTLVLPVAVFFGYRLGR